MEGIGKRLKTKKERPKEMRESFKPRSEGKNSVTFERTSRSHYSTPPKRTPLVRPPKDDLIDKFSTPDEEKENYFENYRSDSANVKQGRASSEKVHFKEHSHKKKSIFTRISEGVGFGSDQKENVPSVVSTTHYDGHSTCMSMESVDLNDCMYEHEKIDRCGSRRR